MATATVMWLKEQVPSFIRLHHFTPVRNLLLGAGMAFAFEQGNYWHLPAVVVLPSVYAGYQAYKARDQVRSFITNPKSLYTANSTEV